jgi:hypothetical protein
MRSRLTAVGVPLWTRIIRLVCGSGALVITLAVLVAPTVTKSDDDSGPSSGCVEFGYQNVCAPPGGSVVMWGYEPVCGRGQCVKTGVEWTCSKVPGGGAVKSPLGAQCVGGCETASPNYCVTPR